MVALQVHELGPVGAEVQGYEPTTIDESIEELRRLFDRYGVLVFRDLDLTHAQQVELTMRLVGKEAGPDGRFEGGPEADRWYVSNEREGGAAPYGRLQFHADMMWSDEPCAGLSLYAIDVEQPAVPTTFVSARRAWDTLPDDLRSRVEGLDVRHSAGDIRRGDVTDVLVSNVEHPPSTVKPMPWTHPRTGDALLFACEQMTDSLVGMPRDESEALLTELFEHLYGDSNRVSHEWRNGDLVVWDNLAMQHARPNVSADGPRRTLRKVATSTPALSKDQQPRHATAS
jgi:alpha-ketoglutarate-dependent taurine dioxygenase